MYFCHVLLPDKTEPVCLPELAVEEKDVIQHGPDVISSLPDLPPPPQPVLASEHTPFLQNVLYGKELLLEETQCTLEELKPFLRAGLVTVRAGLIPTNKGYQCRRCHNSDPARFGLFSCARCQKGCIYCRYCIMMGRISTCSALFRWNGAPPSFSPHISLLWEGVFSKGQKRAAKTIIQTIKEKDELLVWAVCGAGKTEILFPGIETALQSGARVLLATPRTDVVLELLPRLRRVLPEAIIAGLYGKSEEKQVPAQLVIATTHQTMRFTDAFDTVIIDEVDAFPYTAETSLVQAVQKAKKKDAATIYLTATPTTTLQKRVQKHTLPVTKIPRRYHGHPLPVPRFQWCGPWKKRLKKGRLPKPVQTWCEKHIQSQMPAFLFVPSVNVLETITTILKKYYSSIEGVHSGDEDRLSKVAAFRNGTCPLLVTTTILERGVTVPGAEAAVFGAEEDIFTESALVQIAGRVGRSKEQPGGDVVFFHVGKTNAMLAARRHILTMNKAPANGEENTYVKSKHR
ncbi:DEAD/DEAH box helicase [Alteribacillus sp. YIM 98480]|uniref:DEAD/DEAH box helicase n=1 Tax=Alteribacillus sp. YIM 98480 TaxID=2606599 RepID=UPI00131B2599|nr:DEAD/DEAH box helicase [Alteribacillus sp. YIM 98480]